MERKDTANSTSYVKHFLETTNAIFYFLTPVVVFSVLKSRLDGISCEKLSAVLRG